MPATAATASGVPTGAPLVRSGQDTDTTAVVLTGTAAAAGNRRAGELASRIRLQTAFRLLLGVAMLAATAIIHWRGGAERARQYDFRPLYWVAGFVFATSIPVLMGIRRIRVERALAGLATGQYMVDIGVTTALVYLTGGIDSVFTFLYVLTILNASVVLYLRGALLTAAASSIVYGLLIDLNYYGVIRPFAPNVFGGGDIASSEALTRVGGHVAGFLLTGFLASYMAETARRTLAAATIDLRQLQALTKNIVQNLGSGLLTVDRAGRITSFNRTAEEITGRKITDVYGAPIGKLFPGVAQQLGRARPEEETRRLEEFYDRPDGHGLILGLSFSPLRDDEGREIGTIVIFQDLSELRAMETRLKREERLAAVGRLAAGIAHEIRNPLGAISGSIEMLRASVAPASDDARLMEIILRETDRLDGLIGEFLDYVKPLRRNPVEVDVQSVLAETAEAMAATEIGREVKFVLPAAGATGTVLGDRDHIKQVVWNLFLNAAQAMGGKGTVTARVGSRDEREVRASAEQDPLILEISDEGPGIPPDSLSRIFEPFFTTKERGTGLGLAMVHKIVESHHGHIQVESKPGEGAHFRVVLPRKEPEDPRTVA